MEKNKIQGALIYDDENMRYDIRFDVDDFYGGLHCGQCMDVLIYGKWKPTRIEIQKEKWYLVDVPTMENLSGLQVRVLKTW